MSVKFEVTVISKRGKQFQIRLFVDLEVFSSVNFQHGRYQPPQPGCFVELTLLFYP